MLEQKQLENHDIYYIGSTEKHLRFTYCAPPKDEEPLYQTNLNLKLLTNILFTLQMAYYTAFEVMECSWAELIKHLKSAENLDEVIDAHEEFLNSVIRRALLGEGSRDLLTQIRAIYDRIVEFDAVQSRYISKKNSL